MTRCLITTLKVILGTILTFLVITSFPQQPGKPVNEAFRPGEKLEFGFYYDAWLTGKIMAGTGTAEVRESERKFGDRSVWHYDTEGRSKGIFNFFFKVFDQFDSYVDRETLVPYLFMRRTREGGYVKDEDYHFDQPGKKVVTSSGTYKIPANAHDIISVVYYARTTDASGFNPGDNIILNFFLDDSVYTSHVFYEGKENIRIGMGTFRCLRFKPKVVTGNVFSEEYPMTLWISDDKNHLPILATSAIIIGNLRMELIGYENLSNPLDSKLTEEH